MRRWAFGIAVLLAACGGPKNGLPPWANDVLPGGNGGGGSGGSGGEGGCSQIPDCTAKLDSEPCSQGASVCATAICNPPKLRYTGRCETLDRREANLAPIDLFFLASPGFDKIDSVLSFTATAYASNVWENGQGLCRVLMQGSSYAQAQLDANGILTIQSRRMGSVVDPQSIRDFPINSIVVIVFEFKDGQLDLQSESGGPPVATGHTIGKACIGDVVAYDPAIWRPHIYPVSIEPTGG
jgi:hypothetical protein